MAVRVEKKTCISFKSDRFSLLPDSLLEKHGDEDFLRLRPTNQVLLTVLYGEAPPKNASISSSSALKKLLELRKEALDARVQASMPLRSPCMKIMRTSHRKSAELSKNPWTRTAKS